MLRQQRKYWKCWCCSVRDVGDFDAEFPPEQRGTVVGFSLRFWLPSSKTSTSHRWITNTRACSSPRHECSPCQGVLRFLRLACALFQNNFLQQTHAAAAAKDRHFELCLVAAVDSTSPSLQVGEKFDTVVVSTERTWAGLVMSVADSITRMTRNIEKRHAIFDLRQLRSDFLCARYDIAQSERNDVGKPVSE